MILLDVMKIKYNNYMKGIDYYRFTLKQYVQSYKYLLCPNLTYRLKRLFHVVHFINVFGTSFQLKYPQP